MKTLFESWRRYLMKEGRGEVVVALLGPTGAGKSMVRDIFVESGWQKLTSYTTRQPRRGTEEERNQEYKFVDSNKFEELRDGLINVNTYKGDEYGISKEQIRNPAPYQVMITDRTSIGSLRNEIESLGKNIVFVYVTHPDKQVLALNQKERLAQGQITQEEYEERLGELRNEIKEEPNITKSVNYVIMQPSREEAEEETRQLASELKRVT
jgi:guanylate kinase